jgi:UDP-N-acetyl-D-glucosamine dehydrogenase
MAKVAVVGQGYVGMPLAVRAVAVGHEVVGFDLDERRVARLLEAGSYVQDVSDGELAAALATGRFRPTTDESLLDGFDVAVISVPTPLRDGNPDLSHIELAATTVGRHLRAGATVVLESTTYPVTTEELVAPLLSQASGLVAGL